MLSNVLVVGNESIFLKDLPQHLSPYSSDFAIVTAEDEDVALEMLRISMIDLLVVDLKVPQKNGFQLLLHITTQHPLVPILIINAYTKASCNESAASPKSENSLNTEELRGAILDISADPTKAGAIFGVCLGNFLRLIEKENGSCMLAVVTPSRMEGFFLFKDGVLAQAFLNNTRGKEAALAMLAHEKVSIMIRKLPERNIPNEIECSVHSILTEAVQLKNVSTDSEKNDNKLNSAEKFNEVNSHQETVGLKENETKINLNNVLLNNVLQELITINGVTAVGFIRFSGDTLAIKSNDTSNGKMKPEAIIITYNDIFRQASEACKKINMKTLDEVVIYTPKGTVIMLCHGVDSAEHIHLIAVLDPNGKNAFFRMKAAKLLSLLDTHT